VVERTTKGAVAKQRGLSFRLLITLPAFKGVDTSTDRQAAPRPRLAEQVFGDNFRHFVLIPRQGHRCGELRPNLGPQP